LRSIALVTDYDADYERYVDFLHEKYPGRSALTDAEHDTAFEEYEHLYPMELVLYRTRFEIIFYNRPVGELDHFWRLPWDLYIWKKGDFFGLAKEIATAKILSRIAREEYF
jgi:hypothetical protein